MAEGYTTVSIPVEIDKLLKEICEREGRKKIMQLSMLITEKYNKLFRPVVLPEEDSQLIYPEPRK